MSTALALATIQLFFVTTWTIYIVYLPQLAAQAGIPARWVLWILLADQLVFTLVDALVGMVSDRAARSFGRLAAWITAASLVSIGAFVALPFVAPQSAGMLVAALALWAVTSAALRAPPMLLLGKYLPAAAFPKTANVALIGVGLAGAIAPLLTVQLRGMDPVLPFALAGVGLAATVLALRWCERNLAAAAPVTATNPPKPLPVGLLAMGAVFLAGLAFQVNGAINAAPLFTRFAAPVHLAWLLGVFWVGFTLGLIPATMLTQAHGGGRVAVFGCVVAALLMLALPFSPNLAAVITGQLLAGCAWAWVFCAALSYATEHGHTGKEGRNLGMIFALLAFAAFSRIAIIASEWHKQGEMSALLVWLPAGAFGAAAILAWVLVRRDAPLVKLSRGQ